MKRFLMILCLFGIFSVLSTSCKRDGCTDLDANNFDSKATRDDGSCNYDDPPGTVSLTLEIDCATKNGVDFTVGTAECPGCSADTNAVSTDLRFTKDNWEVVAGDTCWGKNSLAIVSVGKVCCLGGIKEIPTTGFTDKLPPAESDGYLIKTREGKYARMYLIEFLTDGFGAISGAKIRFQYPFVP